MSILPFSRTAQSTGQSGAQQTAADRVLPVEIMSAIGKLQP
jgi:hypothetical protein